MVLTAAFTANEKAGPVGVCSRITVRNEARGGMWEGCVDELCFAVPYVAVIDVSVMLGILPGMTRELS